MSGKLGVADKRLTLTPLHWQCLGWLLGAMHSLAAVHGVVIMSVKVDVI